MKRKHRNMRANEKKDGRTLSVHPLFLLAGIYACFTGSLPLYLGAVAVALQHECAHSFAAEKLGFRLNKIVLMPYGAVIRGDLSGISLKDEIAVAAAGPLCNLFTALLFVSLWWLFPDIYPYTEAAFYLSLYIGLGNLLPLYPLDGGRILRKESGKNLPYDHARLRGGDSDCRRYFRRKKRKRNIFICVRRFFVFRGSATRRQLREDRYGLRRGFFARRRRKNRGGGRRLYVKARFVVLRKRKIFAAESSGKRSENRRNG